MKCQYCGIKYKKIIETWIDNTCPDCQALNIEKNQNNYLKLIKIKKELEIDDLSNREYMNNWIK